MLSFRTRVGAGLLAIPLLCSELAGQAAPQILAGTAWSDGVFAPAAELGVRLGLQGPVALTLELGYLRSHVRDSVAFCGITGECPVREVTLDADLVQAQGLLHVRMATAYAPTFLVGGFLGLRSGCGGGRQCDWRHPVQAGPAVGFQTSLRRTTSSPFVRALVQRSFNRTAAALTAESGAEKSYHPIVMHLLAGIAL